MMFYTLLFTTKRGPLAKIWLAAHWERKLTKAHVYECNLETSIRDIISPKMKIGLRTSGHLLIGVVRIYSKKAKYLLADCNEALLKIKIAFRPGQTDMPVEGLVATIKAITLIEDFTEFDSQMPALNSMDVVDHFSLNQSRTEDITIKEDFGNSFQMDFGNKSSSNEDELLDTSFQSLAKQEDAFGDEDRMVDLLDFLTNSSDPSEFINLVREAPQNENHEISALNDQQDTSRMEIETPLQTETSLLGIEESAFALEPVAITPNSERTKGKRKRKLMVDQTKELTREFMIKQLSDYSDLVSQLDMAPPTLQLMQWRESGGADKLFSQPCSSMVAPQMKELFVKSVALKRVNNVHEEAEFMRQGGQEAQRDISAITTESISVADSLIDPEQPNTSELTVLADTSDSHWEKRPKRAQVVNRSESTQPDLPSEDSMFVHPSGMEQTTQSSSLLSQSMLESQDFEERKITRRAQKLLDTLRSQSNSSTTFSLEALCKGGSRWRAVTTFFCFLVLKKQRAIELYQRAPYEDIFATPGAKFCD
ncbi:double-strand-break repair protein rad21-like protein 1 [Xyrichtys novacula]|uniref:Double-strand-break repair protein rad21-like protein 1 n=1 Tax=Xyrichtys novacula TaxID=13765 RepID=A0AAV1HFH6_XYRNO|nr:double-strand-break repair protein rad21-like protein 1 [Xyrichtys novacula]